MKIHILMKNTNKLVLLFFLMFAMSFISCENEPVEPDFLVEVPSACDKPTLFTVSSFINGNSVRIDWDKASGDAWEIQYGIAGFELGTGTTVNFSISSNTISGLVEGTAYQFYIRTKCSDNTYSGWVGPVAPGSISSECNSPTEVTAVRSLTDTSVATVAWLFDGTESTWQVEYGVAGFTIGTGISLFTYSPSTTVNNLIENVSYDFYVRSNCGSTQSSGWVGPINIAAIGAPSTDSFFAKVNGFTFEDTSINVNPNALHNGVSSINIIASNDATHQIDINIDNDVVVGTAYFNTDPLTDKFRFIYFEPVPVEFQTDTNGSITITERTATRIKGTFYFSAINPSQPLELRNITEGTFDVAIP
jgi:hypothetical protein